MTLFSGRLASLRARHIMTPNVVTLSSTASLDEAVELLKRHHITGAPVVDADGRFVGILSLSDVVGIEHRTDEPQKGSDDIPAGSPSLTHGTDRTAWHLFDLASPLTGQPESGQVTVDQRMSRQVATVSVDAPLVDVARLMCDGHWHRVPVIKQDGALCGIVATMDVLAAVVNAADEPD